MVSCRLGRPKCCVVKMAAGSPVKLSLWPFCRRIPGPTDTIWVSSEAKIFHRCGILLVGLGGPTLMKKIYRYKMRIGSLTLSWNGRITQNSFWA